MTTMYDPRDILAARINGDKTPTFFVVLEALGDDTYIIDQLADGQRLGQPRQAEIFDRFRADFADGMQLDNLVYRHDQKKFTGSLDIAGEVIAPRKTITLTDGENEITARTIGEAFNKLTSTAMNAGLDSSGIEAALEAHGGNWQEITEAELVESASIAWNVAASKITLN